MVNGAGMAVVIMCVSWLFGVGDRVEPGSRTAHRCAVKPKARETEQPNWTPEELADFLAYVFDDALDWHALFTTIAITGIRRGEAVGALERYSHRVFWIGPKKGTGQDWADRFGAQHRTIVRYARQPGSFVVKVQPSGLQRAWP
jgi:integrase